MATTTNIALPRLEEGQTKAEVTVNESLNRLDAIGQFIVTGTQASPPASPSDGQGYLVSNSGASGAWAGKENNLALYYSGWLFIAPREGMSAYVQSLDCRLVFNGTSWIQAGPVASLSQTISGTYTQSEVQAISTKVDAILAALRSVGVLKT